MSTVPLDTLVTGLVDQAARQGMRDWSRDPKMAEALTELRDRIEAVKDAMAADRWSDTPPRLFTAISRLVAGTDSYGWWEDPT